MKKILLHILISFMVLIPMFSIAQIENIIVEKYYISDANDATDTTGGYLEPGSITYRVFVDLVPGSSIKKIYGDFNHPLKITSTAPFFNNKVDGQSFGKDFSKNRLQENTVALDSWITLGQTTRASTKTYFGVMKANDVSGSMIGGTNNDGGSAAISGGLIANAHNDAGIPVTTADGMDTMMQIPGSWADYGFVDFISGDDTTVFGSLRMGTEFISYNAGLQNSGTSGVNPNTNLVLVAQLTTKGDITFEINLEVEELYQGSLRTIKYVADGGTLLSDERLSTFLKYPAECGCKDPAYVEYNEAFGCHNQDSCHSIIIYGCTDTLACNFDETANFNIPELCCYPGFCNDRDIEVICPELTHQRVGNDRLEIYPNPAQERISIESFFDEENGQFEIYDQAGKKIMEGPAEKNNPFINISQLSNGLYFISISDSQKKLNQLFIKCVR